MAQQKIVVNIPGKDAPGYLLRQKQALKFRAAIGAEHPSPEAYDELVKFLLDFVVEPKGREEALSALWNATEAQIDEILEKVNAKDAEPPLSK